MLADRRYRVCAIPNFVMMLFTARITFTHKRIIMVYIFLVPFNKSVCIVLYLSRYPNKIVTFSKRGLVFNLHKVEANICDR